MNDVTSVKSRKDLYKFAFILAYITIIYNMLEGLVSVFFGLEDETLSLFGFGVDSFVEVISGVGIFHMLIRIRNNDSETRDEFENTALKITGTSFYLLTIGLVVTAIYNFIIGHKPDTTIWGIIISLISIITMSFLIFYKMKIGKQLKSHAIIADANCTKTCLYLSIILLISSLGYEITNAGGLDSIGALAIAWFSFIEGKEAFEKVKTGKNCSCNH
ncbi:cation transporter [Ignavibacteria bacterium 4148-Me]|uniref:cation transporter n=1 Tax=Rosettibacter primus TaxID=3111523 RepID=UPI00336C0502